MHRFDLFLFVLPAAFSCAVVAAPIVSQRVQREASFAPCYSDCTLDTFVRGRDLQRRSNPPVPSEVSRGSIDYSRHISTLISLVTAPETHNAQFPTWRATLNDVSQPRYFGGISQQWNDEYPAARKIFGEGLIPSIRRKVVHMAHKLVHGPAPADITGTLRHGDDLLRLFKDAAPGRRLRPVMYTYVIETNGAWRFSETGPAFLVDLVSKHALHADVAPSVKYSGEFHWRPVVKGGWSGLQGRYALDSPSTQWELVIDNNSGTYAPDKKLLPNLKALLEHNFPGLRVVALDEGDPELKTSVDALHQYATSSEEAKEARETGLGWAPTIYLLPLVATQNATSTRM